MEHQFLQRTILKHLSRFTWIWMAISILIGKADWGANHPLGIWPDLGGAIVIETAITFIQACRRNHRASHIRGELFDEKRHMRNGAIILGIVGAAVYLLAILWTERLRENWFPYLLFWVGFSAFVGAVWEMPDGTTPSDVESPANSQSLPED